MLSLPDFEKKQILFINFNEGEKIAFSNENVVFKDKEGKIKLQCSCYNIYLIFAMGHFSITSPLVQKCEKYGFFIVLMTSSFKVYDILGNAKNGNTLLKQKQYNYDEIDIAKLIVKNKIYSQQKTVNVIRSKSEIQLEFLKYSTQYLQMIDNCTNIQEIMGFEGMTSKLYFRCYFDNILWHGRRPRIKQDYVNSTLDIGYTILFNFLEALLLSHGFDVYVGVLHRQFYMRKSLVCDIIEPFRVIIDKAIKKGVNLNQIKEEDFKVVNYQYRLRYEKNSKYIRLFMEEILKEKQEIFKYVQEYYRAFMKEKNIKDYPFYK